MFAGSYKMEAWWHQQRPSDSVDQLMRDECLKVHVSRTLMIVCWLLIL